MSPVCSQPSASIVAAVASGVVEIALHHLRPAHPDLAALAGPSASPFVGIHDRASVFGRSGPTAPGCAAFSVAPRVGDRARLGHAVALEDLRAEPFGARPGGRCSSGAAPDMITLSDDRSKSSTSGCLARASTIGGTT